MQIEEIRTTDAPMPRGAYSQGVRFGDLVYTSGQLPIDPVTNQPVKGGIVEQVHRALKNVCAVLAAAGTDTNHVLKVTIYISDMSNWDVVDKIYREYFSGSMLPTRSVVAIRELHYGMAIEVEAVAVVPTRDPQEGNMR